MVLKWFQINYPVVHEPSKIRCILELLLRLCWCWLFSIVQQLNEAAIADTARKGDWFYLDLSIAHMAKASLLVAFCCFRCGLT